MNFGALSRGFGTCCLRFKNRVATIPAKLASGWLARLYREGVEPSGSLQKVSDHISRPPFLDFSWRKGISFRVRGSRTAASLTVYVAPANPAGMVVLVDPFRGADMKRRESAARRRGGVAAGDAGDAGEAKENEYDEYQILHRRR